MRLLVTIILVTISSILFAQTSTVRGIVTFYISESRGDKPDLGARVYLIEKNAAMHSNLSTIDTFVQSDPYLTLHLVCSDLASFYEVEMKKLKEKRNQSFYDMKKAYEESIKCRIDAWEQMKLYGVETNNKFNELDFRAHLMVEKINDKDFASSTIDATGSYSFNVKPGNYYVFMISKNRTGLSKTETRGKIYLREIELRENQTLVIDKNFGLESLETVVN